MDVVEPTMESRSTKILLKPQMLQPDTLTVAPHSWLWNGVWVKIFNRLAADRVLSNFRATLQRTLMGVISS